jgi:hypothetical protein
MNTTSTRNVDSNGNVSYTIKRGEVVLGTVDKCCSGYQATFVSGSYVPAKSIKAARELIEDRA